MAQPRTIPRAPAEAVTARVEVQSLSVAEAVRQMASPVTLRNGRIRSLIISVPLIEQRNRYLVLQVPQSIITALNDHLLSLPGGGRGRYMRRWHHRNQMAMLEAYTGSGVAGRAGRQRFDFHILPLSAVRVAGTTPVRTETRRGITPRVSAVPATRAATPPRITSPGPVETSAAGPAERVPAVRLGRRLSLPGGVRTGTFEEGGRMRQGYIIRPSTGRARSGAGAGEVEIPFTFDVQGLGRMRVMVNMTLSQVGARARLQTINELSRLIRATISYHAGQAGRRVEGSAVSSTISNLRGERGGFLAAVRRIEAMLPAEGRRYVESH